MSAVLLGGPLAFAAAEPQTALATDRLNRSESCGQCHAGIHQLWRDSVHARSFTDSIFQAALEKTGDTRGAAARRVCLACHAPAALVSGDYEAKEAVTREGVGCDFCHSIKGVDLARRPHPFEIELGGVKRGPYAYLKSPAHETAYSELHRSSPLLCAACHEYVNESGVAVLATYSEWKEGPYPALGVACQGCHMAIVPGERVVPELASAPGERLINLHRLVGGSSLSQLRRGLDATIEGVRREGGDVEVKVQVQNVAAGHKVPTGLPPKQVKLVVSASREGREVFSAERIYGRVLLDASGKPPATEGEIFLSSQRVARDTRLAPRETRTEIFRFPAPPGELALRARLVYQYKPLVSEHGVEEVIRELEATAPR